MTRTPAATFPYVQLGESGLFVYALGLGTMQFGWSVDEAGAFDVLDAYDEAGGNFIDSADVYSSWAANMGGPANPGGISEEIVGRWLAARGNRDRMIIATKVRPPWVNPSLTTVAPNGNERDCHAAGSSRPARTAFGGSGSTTSICTKSTGSILLCRLKRQCRR